jgi:bifunctional DNA-binding transcriptional regulator/antitoxin component of YhaV-PrlF toxin-antitoxin module
MTTIKLTAKRQATFPQSLCKELNLEPGDAIGVQKRIVGGKAVWCLERISEPDLSWMGRFRKKARGKVHDMESIERSVQRARRRGDA